MEENNQNYIYGFPKVTQIIMVGPSLDVIGIRIPRTFFINNSMHRTIQYEGLKFSVSRIKEDNERHSTVCTGMMKYNPPKTFSQVSNLSNILTYFAHKDSFIIRKIKHIASKEIQCLARKISPTIDLKSSHASHQQGSSRQTRRGNTNRRTTKMESSQIHFTNNQNPSPRSNSQILTSHSSREQQNLTEADSQSVPLENQSNATPLNLRSYNGMYQQPSMLNQDDEQDHDDHQNIMPLDLAHTITSSNMRNNEFYPNQLRSPNHPSQQAQINNTTTSGGSLEPTRYHDHLNQPIIRPPINKVSTAPNMACGMNIPQPNNLRKPNHTIHYQPQTQVQSVGLFNQQASIPSNYQCMTPYMNQSNDLNQFCFANRIQLQNRNLAQNVQYSPHPSIPLQMTPQTHDFALSSNLNQHPLPTFHESIYMERNLTQMPHSTSNNHLLRSTFFAPPNTDYISENFYPVQPHQNQYPQISMTQWQKNAPFAQNEGFTRTQNYQPSVPLNSQINNGFSSSGFYHQQRELEDWQLPTTPQITNLQAIQSNQACAVSNHPANISSNRFSNLPVRPPPPLEWYPENSKKPMYSNPTNSLNNLSTNNIESENWDSNSPNTYAKETKDQSEPNNTKATEMSQGSSATANSSVNEVPWEHRDSTVFNKNVISKRKETFQSSVVHSKLHSVNSSQGDLLISESKEEPIDCESQINNGFSSSGSNHQQRGFEGWQLPTTPQITNLQAIQSNQACAVSNHPANISSNHFSNRAVRQPPPLEWYPENSKKPLHSISMNSLENFPANNIKSENWDSNSPNTYAKQTKDQSEPNNTKATEMSQGSSDTSNSSINEVPWEHRDSTVFNKNVIPKRKETFQSSVVQSKLYSVNSSQSDLLIGESKEEPIDCESQINNGFFSFGSNNRQRRFEDWQLTTTPQITNPQGIQANQACAVSNHPAYISSNHFSNRPVRPPPPLEWYPENSKKPMYSNPTNSLNNLSTNNIESENWDSNSPNTYTKLTNHQSEPNTTKATEMSQGSSATANSSKNEVRWEHRNSTVFNKNVVSKRKETFQNSVVQSKLYSVNSSQSYLLIGESKEEPIDCESQINNGFSSSGSNHQQRGFKDWQLPTTPQITNPQGIQTNQACAVSNHPANISSNHFSNRPDRQPPPLEWYPENSKRPLHSISMNSLENFSANNIRSENWDSNSHNTYAKQTKDQSEPNNTKATEMSQGSSDTAYSSINNVPWEHRDSTVFNKKVISKRKETFQSSVVQSKLYSVNSSQSDLTGEIKDKPTDCESLDRAEDETVHQNFLNLDNFQTCPSTSLSVVEQEKPMDEENLNICEDLFDLGNVEIITRPEFSPFTPPRSNDSSPGLFIDETELI